MSLLTWTAKQGELDHRNAPFFDRLLLVCEDGTVVGHRGFEKSPIGENLIPLLGIRRAEEQSFRAVLDVPINCFSLIHVGTTSVPVLRSLFAATGLQLVLIPAGRVAQELRTPAHLTPYLSDFVLTRTATAHRGILTKEGADAVTKWLRPYHRAFLHECKDSEASRDLEGELMHIIPELAALCGCCVEYDLYGLVHASRTEMDVDFVKGVLLALFLAVRRTAKDRRLLIRVSEAKQSGDTLYATFAFDGFTGEQTLPELEPIRAAARRNGAVFDYFPSPNAKEQICVIVQLLRVERQEQQGKIRTDIGGTPREYLECTLPDARDYPEITARAVRDLHRLHGEPSE